MWGSFLCGLCLLSDWSVKQCWESCHGGWRMDADQTSYPRDVFHHHNRGGLWVWGTTYHTPSRGRWNQSPHQLLPVQRLGSHESVPILLNLITNTMQYLFVTEMWFHMRRQQLFTSLAPAFSSIVSFYPGCYGVDPASVSKEWKCARCKANAMTEVCKFSGVDLHGSTWILTEIPDDSLWFAASSYSNKIFCVVGLDNSLITCCFCRIAVYVRWEVEPCKRPTITSK